MKPKPAKQAKPVKAWAIEDIHGDLQASPQWSRGYAKSYVVEGGAYVALHRVEIRVIGGKK